MPKKPDNVVGDVQKSAVDSGRQTPEQAAIVAPGEGGLSDEERARLWAEDADGSPGRPPVALGGSSQGQADRMPTGGASKVNEPASNPAVTPGNRHETS